MRNKRNWIIPGILILALLATGVWGLQESQARQGLQNRAESQYQKNFYELVWHIDIITGQLAQLIVSSSAEQGVIGLASLWRQAFAAQSNIGGLPLAFVSLSNTEKFLSDTGEITHALLSRVTKEAGALSEGEINILKQLYERANNLDGELVKLAAGVLDKQLSWTEVELAAINSNTKLADNTILDGFEIMEQKMEEYPELELGEDFQTVRADEKKMTGEKKISLEEAKKLAGQWWFGGSAPEVRLIYEGAGNIPTYGLEFSTQKKGEIPVYMDVSKLDGTIVWALKPKAAAGAQVTLDEAGRRAREFLQNHGYFNLVQIDTDMEDNNGIFTFVPRQGDILIYPDQLSVQVALDEGDIIGFEGTPYYMNHQTRNLPPPVISEERLRATLSPNLQVDLIRLALIDNYWGQEVLTWEVRGSFAKEDFVIYYNTHTGIEEEFTRITPPQKHNFNVAGA
ncbi:MAG: germination protein YpeB [Clostridia bacterium]|nr:germination protein YpeB [Clostridia bacterium]